MLRKCDMHKGIIMMYDTEESETCPICKEHNSLKDTLEALKTEVEELETRCKELSQKLENMPVVMQ